MLFFRTCLTQKQNTSFACYVTAYFFLDEINMAHINEKCSEGSLVALFKMLATIVSPKRNVLNQMT